MDYKNMHFDFLQKDCIKAFGQEKGAKIFAKACEILASMLDAADYGQNESIKKHIEKNMFPTMAYYFALQDYGYTKDKAYAFTLNETQKAAFIQQAKNKALGKMPLAYIIFKRCIKKVMKKIYPAEGWDTEWIKVANKEIHMNFTKCLYVDLTLKYGCPELCSVFCKNDTVVFAGYKPKIHFHRTQTIADGKECFNRSCTFSNNSLSTIGG